MCVAKAIRKYFQTGQLPPPDTLCSTDLKPLLGIPNKSAMQHAEAIPADRRLYDALIDDVSTFAYARSIDVDIL